MAVGIEFQKYSMFHFDLYLNKQVVMMPRVLMLVVFALLGGCSEEQQNRLGRLGVTWLEGDHRVTYADGQHVKTWLFV